MILRIRNLHNIGVGRRPVAPRDGGIRKDRDFRQIVRRERTRADRIAHSFALVVFDLQPRHLNGELDPILRSLIKNVRAADEVGWVERKALGVLLPDTDKGGAAVFCMRVKLDLAGKASVPEHSVYVYPDGQTDDDDDEDGGNQQLHFPTILSSTRKRSPLPLNSEPGEEAREPAAAAPKECAGPPAADPPMPRVRGIEDFFSADFPAWKRAIDVVGSLAVLILFAPLMLLIAALIKLLSPGPVVFKQTRIGHAGKPFICLKFRTMHADNDDSVHNRHFARLLKSTGAMTKLDRIGDSRVFPFGTVLRVTALDELPQLINVLKGDMSLIGPRPCIPYEYESYRRWFRGRIDARPGLTGLWQVCGKNRLTVEEMMRLDIRYSWDKCLLLDLIILLKTPFVVLRQIEEALAAKWARAAFRM